MYERLLGRKLDKSAFRKRVAEAGFLVPVEGEMRRASNRPAQVFRLKDAQSLVLFDRTLSEQHTRFAVALQAIL